MCHSKQQILIQPWAIHRQTGKGQVQRTKFTDITAFFRVNFTKHAIGLKMRAPQAVARTVSMPGNVCLPRKIRLAICIANIALHQVRVSPGITWNRQETGIPTFTITGTNDGGRTPEVYEAHIHLCPPAHLQLRAEKLSKL